MSIIKPNRDTLFDMLEECLESTYLCNCFAESSSLRPLLPEALDKAEKAIDRFYETSRYDYPEELAEVYNNIHCVDFKKGYETEVLLKEAYDALLAIHEKLVFEDNSCDNKLEHEDYCDRCQDVVDLFNAIQLYKKMVPIRDIVITKVNEIAQKMKEVFEMAKAMMREHQLPRFYWSMFQGDFEEWIKKTSIFDLLSNYGSSIVDEFMRLSQNCGGSNYDLTLFLIYLCEMNGISSFTFDNQSELFRLEFAKGWEQKGMKGLALIDFIEVHQQADSHVFLINAWKGNGPTAVIYSLNLNEDQELDWDAMTEEEAFVVEKLINILELSQNTSEIREATKEPEIEDTCVPVSNESLSFNLMDSVFPYDCLKKVEDQETDQDNGQGKDQDDNQEGGPMKEDNDFVVRALVKEIERLNEIIENQKRFIEEESIEEPKPSLVDEIMLSLIETNEAIKEGKELRTHVLSRSDVEDLAPKNESSSKDPINPDYYKRNGLECIDIMEFYLSKREMIGFCKGTAFKYLWRAGQKEGNSASQDYNKADWYLAKLAALEETF